MDTTSGYVEQIHVVPCSISKNSKPSSCPAEDWHNCCASVAREEKQKVKSNRKKCGGIWIGFCSLLIKDDISISWSRILKQFNWCWWYYTMYYLNGKVFISRSSILAAALWDYNLLRLLCFIAFFSQSNDFI